MILHHDLLHLKLPIGRTLGLTLIWLLALASLSELVVRVAVDQSNIPLPAASGTNHNGLAAKLSALDAFVADRGRVDCIFMGSSLVMNGIDPAVLAAAYRQQTGQDIVCYNFGLISFSASEVGLWAEILALEYHPRWIVFGASPRDFSARAGGENLGWNAETPWTRYRLGAFAPEGWLIEHSRAYRLFLCYRNWLAPESADCLTSRRVAQDDMGQNGYQANHLDFDIHAPITSEAYAHYHYLLAAYALAPDDLAGLRRLAGVTQYGVQPVLVEMPVPDPYLAFFDEGTADYLSYLTQLDAITTQQAMPFLKTWTLDIVPDNGWSDYLHLNARGATALSRWLGQRFGQTVAPDQR